MNVNEMSRQEKVDFLLSADKAEPKYFCYGKLYGDFSDVSDEFLDLMVEELDWMWK